MSIHDDMSKDADEVVRELHQAVMNYQIHTNILIVTDPYDGYKVIGAYRQLSPEEQEGFEREGCEIHSISLKDRLGRD